MVTAPLFTFSIVPDFIRSRVGYSFFLGLSPIKCIRLVLYCVKKGALHCPYWRWQLQFQIIFTATQIAAHGLDKLKTVWQSVAGNEVTWGPLGTRRWRWHWYISLGWLIVSVLKLSCLAMYIIKAYSRLTHYYVSTMRFLRLPMRHEKKKHKIEKK